MKAPCKPWCPFCRGDVERPREPERRQMGDSPRGNCACGAVYVADPTGHNIGSAMVECLVAACGDNWDMAWDLLPEEDYLTGRIEDYDDVSHQVIETGACDGRKVKGVLYFVRLQESARIARQDGAASAARPARRPLEPLPVPGRARRRVGKEEVRRLVDAGDEDGLVAACFDDGRTLLFCQRLLYDPDTAKRWRLVDCIGRVTARLATRRPGQVSDCLHRLFAAASDSAAMGWGAVETIGAIIAGQPEIFGAFTRHLLPHAAHAVTRVQTLWALAAIAAASPMTVRRAVFYPFLRFLDDADPAVRGHAVVLYRAMEAGELCGRLEKMVADTGPLAIFAGGHMKNTTVGELAAQALGVLRQKERKES